MMKKSKIIEITYACQELSTLSYYQIQMVGYQRDYSQLDKKEIN